MADDTKFTRSYVGIGEMLRADFMVADMAKRADAVAARAASSAPEGDPATDPHAGRYRESFGTEAGVKGDRAYGRVTNTAPESLPVEYGLGGTPKYRTLGRSLGAAGDRGGEPYTPGPATARAKATRYRPPGRR